MLKITAQADATNPMRMRVLLEGRLAGPWVEELDRCWTAMEASQQRQVLVDLSGVTFIAPEGKALLTRMWQRGATFHAADCLTRCLLDEIADTDPVHGRQTGNT